MHFIWIYLSVDVTVQKYWLKTLLLRLILDCHFTWLFQPWEGLAVCRGKEVSIKLVPPSLFAITKKCTPPPLHFTLLLKISLLQKSAIHVLSNSVYGSYTASLFAKLKILEIFLVFLCYMLLNLCSAIIIICCLLLFWTYIITGAQVHTSPEL